MSAVSEEDVLAVGLLHHLVYKTLEGLSGVPSEWADDVPAEEAAVWDVRRNASDYMGALADSERRYAVECAEREVLEAAERWFDADYGTDGPAEVDMMDALHAMRMARQAVS